MNDPGSGTVLSGLSVRLVGLFDIVGAVNFRFLSKLKLSRKQ